MLGIRSAWVAQSIKRLTLNFSSGRELRVCKIEPFIGLCADSQSLLGILSLPLLLSLSLSLSLFKIF